MEKFLFVTTDGRGRQFDQFYVAKSDADGPGYYIFGRNPEYGGRLIMLCGRPDVAPRKHPHYNCKVRRGWKTRREAIAALAAIQRDA